MKHPTLKGCIKGTFSFLSIIAIVGLIGCGENKDENNDPAVYWLNGKCRSTSTHDTVDITSCKGAGDYFIDRNQCVQRSTDQVVSMTNCRNNSDYYWTDGKCYKKSTNTQVSRDFCFDPESPNNGYQRYNNNGYNNYFNNGSNFNNNYNYRNNNYQRYY